MSARSVVAAAGIGLAAVTLGFGLASLLTDTASSRAPYRGSVPPAAIQLPEFELRDERGDLLGNRDVRGKVVVLTFLDSQCRETCPVVAGLLADGIELVPRELRRSVAALAVSTDPAGDSAASRRAFLRRHGADGIIRYLSGPLAALEPVWKAFQILSSHESGDDDLHSAPVRIYDTSGLWVSTLHAGADLTPANLAHDVREALRAGGRSE